MGKTSESQVEGAVPDLSPLRGGRYLHAAKAACEILLFEWTRLES